MKQTAKRGLALLTAFVLVFSLMPQIHHHTAHAASTEVDYVTSGDYIYNWGTRGTPATFLSPKAEEFYTGNDTYDVLSQLTGGTSTDDAPASALYDALQDLMVSRHTYETSYDDTRPLFQYTDCENSAKTSNKISSFYSGTPIGPDWDEGATWNREHTWPNSKGDASGNGENDIMMLRPASMTENSGRGNKAYGTTTNDDFYYPNDESNDQYDVRGDVARIVLYVYVRWGNTGSMWGSAGVIESLDVLLDWMAADPVDTWEMGRNDSVEAITGTRNVFVDYPEFAFLLFGAEMPENMTTPSGSNMDHTHNYTAAVTTAATCTTNGVRTYTCSICQHSYTESIPAIGHNYVAGVCSNCGEAEPTGYTATLVTSASQLSVGAEVIIVAQDYDFAMSTTQNSNNRGKTDVTKSADGSAITFTDGSDIQVITLEAGTKSGTYAFNVGDGYLYAASSSSNNLRTETTLTDNSSWLITVSSSGTVVAAQGSNTRNLMQYNTSGMFSCYATGNTMKAVALYVIGNGEGDGEDTECAHSYTSTVTTAATCTADGVRTYTCSLCGNSYIEVIPATGHNYVAGVCTGCGEAEPAELTAKPVTSVVELSVGQQIIIVAQDYDYALSTAQNGNNRGQAAITRNGDGTITFTEGSDVQVITLEAGTKDGTYAFNVGNGYLYAASSSKNYLRTETTLSDNSSWSITISNNSATVTAQGTNTRNLLQYNQSSSIFSAYGSAQKAITLYVIDSDNGEGEDTECTHSYTSEVTTTATCTADGARTYTCSLCGDSYIEVIPATGHSYVGGTCTSCGKAEPAEITVTLVTDVSKLRAGQQIIIAAKDFNYALSTTQNNNNRGRIAITKSTDGSTITFMDDAGVQLITLEAGTKDGTFAFNVEDGYLYAASAGSNHLKTETTLSDNSSWLITITDGVASVVAQGTNTRNILRYNDGNGIFSCYGSGQLDIAIYVIDNGETEPDPEPGCTHANTTIEGAADATCTEAGHTGKTVCSDCGETLDAGSAIPALGHDYVEGVCSRCGAEKPNLAVVTIDLTTKDNRTVYNAEQQIWKQNNITVTNDKAASTNDVGDYVPARFYKSSKLTIAYPGMTQIVFNCNDYKTTYAADLVTSIGTMDGVTATADGAVVTVVFAAACDSFVIEQLAAQIRVDSITVTGAVIESSCAHANTTTEGAADATCTEAGHTGKTVCSDCGETLDAGSAIPALGHDYVDGVCSRCGDKNCVLSVIESPVAGTAYKFGMVQENVSTTDVYYLTGEMEGYYMDTVTDKAAAIDVYLESATGGYYLYTMIDGVKTYINMVVNGTYVNGAYEAAASTVYTFDATSKTIVAEVNGSTYWFGTRNDKTYTTVGPCDVSRGGFYCQFYGEVTGDVAPECQHTNTAVEGAADATCTEAGHTGKTVCSDCGETLDAGSAIPALGHDYVDGVCSRCGETESAADPEVEGVTIDLTNMDNRTVYNAEQQVWKQNGITVTNDKAASTTDVGDYAPARFYKGSKLTVAYPGMTQIVFNCNDYKDTYASALAESIGTVDGVTVTVDGTVVTVAFAAARDSFVIEQLTAQVRVNSIVVVAAASEETPCEHANTTVEGAADATCTAAGHTGKTVCSDCGETLDAGSAIPAFGHDYVDGVCSRCGDTVTPVVPVPTPKPDPKPQPQPQPKPEPDPEPEQKPEQDIDSAEVFEDLSEDNWYYDAVDYMIDSGLMNGVSESEFAPEEELSRAMMWTILARLSGENTEGGATWYEKGRQWAMEAGITDGADSNGEITREQLVVMLWRFMGEPASSGDLTSYTDTDSVSNWAEEAMAWAIEVGLINGVTSTTLAPQNFATRAQVATILWRFCENILKD